MQDLTPAGRRGSLILAVSAGLALADSSVVALALPQLLRELDTTVDGVAAVLGVYVLVLALGLIPAARFERRHGAARVGAAGFGLMAAASLLCAAAGSLPVLLVGRALQAAGGAAGLIAAFTLIDAAARIRGPATTRAAAGALLIGAGTLCLAFLPGASVAWTIVPQLLAGTGMGLALPALAGELVPERTAGDAARLLTVRHAGIVLVLAAVAPVVSHQLDNATHTARLRGIALVLDAKLPPQAKLPLAPALLTSVNSESPREGLRKAIRDARAGFTGQDSAVFDTMATRADDTLVAAVGDAFNEAFIVAGALGLAAAVVLLVAGGALAAPARWALGLATAALVAVPVYAPLHSPVAPERG